MHLNAWQLLIWIVGLELLSAPILVFVINAATNGYFKAKEQHYGRVAGAIGKAMESNGKALEKAINNFVKQAKPEEKSE